MMRIEIEESLASKAKLIRDVLYKGKNLRHVYGIIFKTGLKYFFDKKFNKEVI